MKSIAMCSLTLAITAFSSRLFTADPWATPAWGLGKVRPNCSSSQDSDGYALN